MWGRLGSGLEAGAGAQSCAGVSGLSCPESQQVSSSPVDEDRYACLMRGHRVRWEARAVETADPRHHPATVHTYAVNRARALNRTYVEKIGRCAKRGVRIKCKCRGWRGVRWFGCRQHLTCERCCQQRSRQLGQRIRAGLEVAHAGAGPGAKLVLLTLTVRHSGDVARDRDAIAAGWRRFYKALRARWGAWPYVGVWEVTAGADEQGHVHAHVAVVWPWRDWGEVRKLWLRACPESERIHFVAARRDGRPSDARSVGRYLGKYLAKSTQDDGITRELRADVVAMAYGQRSVFTSRGFWQPWHPVCKCCGCPRVLAQYRWHGDPYRPEAERPPPEQLWLGLRERAGPGCA